MNAFMKPVLVLGIAATMGLAAVTPSSARNGGFAAAGAGFAAGAIVGAAAANARGSYGEPAYGYEGYGYDQGYAAPAYGYESYGAYGDGDGYRGRTAYDNYRGSSRDKQLKGGNW